MPRYIDLDKLNEYPIRLNHYDKENGNVNFVYGIESVLEYANSLPVFETDWISVKDKMPEEKDLLYLVLIDGYRYSLMRYGCDNGKWIWYGDEYDDNFVWLACREQVTHWMPLPEPPKEGE